MDPVEQFETEGARVVIFVADQPEYQQLPALVFPDGKVLREWCFTEEERAAVAKGENLRLWIWTFGRPLQPIALALTDERKG